MHIANGGRYAQHSKDTYHVTSPSFRPHHCVLSELVQQCRIQRMNTSIPLQVLDWLSERMFSALGIRVFAGTVLAGLPATTAHPRLDATSVRSTVPPEIVAKTVVSDKIRLVFLAGLEGSGHHYFRSVGETVFEANAELPHIHNHLDVKPFYLPFSMGGSASNYAKAGFLAREGMQWLSEQAARLSRPTFYLPRQTMSYPQNGGPKKVVQYNDLTMMAKAAEMEGLDLRVVYLKRSAQDMIIANTVHRGFQT